MGRQVHRLSAKAVEKAKRPGYYCDGGGLYLQVSPTLSKSWIFRYTHFGKTREMGLGSSRDVSLAEARGKASDARRQLVEGVDPIRAREELRTQQLLQHATTITFAECARRYIESQRARWRNDKHADQWTNTLETYAGNIIGPLSVKDIDTGLVLRVLEPVWEKKPETATRLRGRIEKVLDFAKTKLKARDGENPARWRGHLDMILAPGLNRQNRKHHAALPYDELPAFMKDLRAQPGVAARALEWTILTASRTGAVIGGKPTEVDVSKAVWTIPPERNKPRAGKPGREHRVPLSERAMAIAKEQMAADAPYLFPGLKDGEPLSNMAMLELLKRMGRGDLTVHGFRSTFRDWAAESTTYANEVCEMALGHEISNKVEAAYRRGDLFEKRRQLMNDWAKYCEAPKAGATVTPMKRAAAAA